MSRKHWSADHHGVRQWSGDGQSLSAARKAGVTFAIVFSVLLAVGAVALAVSGGSGGKQLTAFAFRGQGDVATAPVDGAGNAISLNQTAAQAAASLNCTLAVPANPLSAQGLATPWQLGDGCTMANPTLRAVPRGRHSGPERHPFGLRPADHHGGDPAGRRAGRPDDRERLTGHHQRRLQRHQPGADRRGRTARGVRRRARPVGDRPGSGLQRGRILPRGQRRRSRAAPSRSRRPGPARTGRHARPRATSA